jgi:putative nucleotidyltransferase with HDIG domain
MSKHVHQQAAARQIERVLRRSGGISTLPEVAAELLTLLAEEPCDMPRLAALVQTDSTLSALILSLAARERIAFTDGRADIQEAVALLPRELLREAILSVRVFPTLNWTAESESRRLLPRRQLALHSLATACCAELLAEFVLPPEQRPAAYLAGLLHDVGKTALDEIMPKSVERLVEQARDTGRELYEIEQEQLGLDHAMLGRRLAEKWQLPASIVASIWLHHTDPHTLAALQQEPLLPATVALADRLARKAALGQSGSYNEPEDIEDWTAFLKLTADQLRHVQDTLPLSVTRQCEMIQWSPQQGTDAYIHAVQHTAVGLARRNRQLSKQSQKSVALNGQNTLIAGFLDEVSAYSSPAEVAEQFAAFWQKQHLCGTTAVVVLGETAEIPDALIEMAVTERNGRTHTVTIHPPTDQPLVPEALKQRFDIVPLSGSADWLLEAIEADLNPPQMRLAPLAVQDKLVGLLAFEASEPSALDREHCETACRIAAFAIAMAMSIQKHDDLSDRFVQMLGTLRRTRTDLARTQSMQALAEMAAGAAHELNNPLAVISGRAQLLMAAEEDETKKQMLRQIQQRTEEIAQIISDLMSFAKPSTPEKRQVTLAELIQKAAEKTCARHHLDSLELEPFVDDNESVYVDVHQVTEALAQIFSNALQSYPGQNGPIRIEAEPQANPPAVVLKISDRGCGMDAETLSKATEPFFSQCPAGRRRGMGLAHARRLLQLNEGTLRMQSAPDQGTTVFVGLPKA